MKEVTTIITAEITAIRKYDDDTADMYLQDKEEYTDTLTHYFKEKFKADDVHIKVQDFVMDAKE